jgi:hypothetical protein
MANDPKLFSRGCNVHGSSNSSANSILRRRASGLFGPVTTTKGSPSHAYLSHRRIGKRRDVLNALPQFVEHCDASLDQRAAIRRRLYALPAAVEQAHAEGVFQICDRLGHGRLRHIEGGGRLPHAARLNDGQQNIHVSQFEAAADAVVPLRGGGHSKSLWYHSIIILSGFEQLG